VYNLNYATTTLVCKVEGKLYLGVREQKRLNITDEEDTETWNDQDVNGQIRFGTSKQLGL
jgi:hypothetical protein